MLSFIPSFTDTMKDYQRQSLNSWVDAKKEIRQAKWNKQPASWGSRWNAHVQPRVANAAYAIGNVFAGVVDTTIGTVEQVVDIASFGYIRADNRLYWGARNIVSAPFKNVIHVLNPAADFPIATDYIQKARSTLGGNAYVDCNQSTNFFLKHIVSRFFAVTSCLASIVARIVFLVVGIFAAIGSILSLGNWTAANKWASYGLTFPLIINDVGVLLKRLTRLA